jgi:hypothetical protein
MSDNLSGYGRALGQGLAMGWSDEAEARARSAVSGRSYEDELRQIRREYADFSERNPIGAPLAEFVGGVVPSVAGMLLPGTQAAGVASGARTLGALGRLGSALKTQMGFGKTVSQRTLGENIARASGVGAVQGGIGGAGAADGDMGARAMGAGIGTGIGALLGPATVAAPAAAGSFGRWAGQYITPTDNMITDAAARRMLGSLEMSPQEMMQKLSEDAMLGVPSRPMNVSRGATGMTDILAQRPGESQRIIGEAIGDQRRGQRDRIVQNMQSTLSNKNYYDEMDSLQQRLRTLADEAYEAAYRYGPVDDPVIMGILRDNPRFKEAFARARAIANTERTNAQALGKDPSQFELQSVYRSTGQYDPQVVSALRQMGIPEDRMSSYLGNLGGDAMEMAEVMVPDVRTLDYIKRGLDSIINEGYRGQGMSVPEAAALKDLRNTFVNRIDEIVPEYRAARRQYAGDLEVRNAAEAGFEQFDRLDPEQVSRMFKDFSNAEKDAFRAGAARQLWGVVMNPSNEADYARRIIGSPATQQKLREIFPSGAAYDLFEAALKRESQLFKDASTVLGNSTTARRQAGMQAFEADPLLDSAAILTQQGFEGGIVNGVLNALSRNRVSDDVAKKMAEWLTADDPQKVAAVVEALEAFATQQAPRVTQRTGLSSALSGGILGAGFPAPYAEPDNDQ